MSETLLNNQELLSLLARYRKELALSRKEREVAMRALGEIQRQLSETQSRARIGTWERWLDKDKIFWSDQTYRIFGLEPGEIEPSVAYVLSVIHPDDLVRVRTILDEAVLRSSGFSIEYRLKLRDGVERTVRAENRIELDVNQKPIRIVGTIEDISPELEPGGSETPAELSSDSSRVSWWEWEIDTDVIVWSNEVYRIFGIDPDSFRPTVESYLACVHPDDRKYVEREVTLAAKRGKSFSFEHRIVLPNGDERTVMCSGERMTEDLRPARLLGTVQDITARKRAQEQLHQSEMKYRALFEEMKRTNEQLTIMSRRLSSVQEEERRRISLELHDEVGGQLSALQLAIQVIDPDRDDILDRILSAEHIADSLIEHIRSISRKLRPSSLDRLGLTATLSGLISQVERLYNLDLNAEIDVQNERDIDKETQIAVYRIVQEALTNVARHSEVTEAEVSVLQRSSEILIRVTDRGVGLSMPTGELLIDSIGISGMRERAIMLGGTFDIGSADGRGTSIRAKIPLSGP
jgi:two-component system, NarL family, sensor histidine kinase UhpB